MISAGKKFENDCATAFDGEITSGRTGQVAAAIVENNVEFNPWTDNYASKNEYKPALLWETEAYGAFEVDIKKGERDLILIKKRNTEVVLFAVPRDVISDTFLFYKPKQ